MSTDSSWVPAAGTVLDGRYRLMEAIDRGGMGVILRAHHLGLDRDVAVKVLRPEKVGDASTFARFQREVAVAAQLEHHNIVQCHDSGETPDGALYLVMELLEGRTLKQALLSDTRFDLQRAADLAAQMLDGLATAHAQGFIHRDLKPSNIFLVRDMRGREVVKLLDFGLAKSIFADDVKITQTGAICGTTSYFAPELLFGDAPTPGIDVYACGLIMLEMVTGRKSFDADAVAQALLQHMSVPALIPRRLWETPYGQLVAQCLRKHPGERPRDADELLARLRHIQPHLPSLRLDDREIPPTADGVRDPGMLAQVLAGELTNNAVLRQLPSPEPFDVVAPPEGEIGQRSNVATYEFRDAPSAPLELAHAPQQRSGSTIIPVSVAPQPQSEGNWFVMLVLLVVVGLAGGGFYLTSQQEPQAPPPPRELKLPPSVTSPPAATVSTTEEADLGEPKAPKAERAKRAPKRAVEKAEPVVQGGSRPTLTIDNAAQNKLMKKVNRTLDKVR